MFSKVFNAKAWVLVGLAVIAMPSVDGKQETVASLPTFSPGQEWSVKSKAQSTAKVIIGRIEPWNGKVAIHISLVDLPVSSQAGTFGIREIAHLPIEETALADSVDKLLAKNIASPGDFEAGYKEWRDKRGGIYTTTVAQLIELLMQ